MLGQKFTRNVNLEKAGIVRGESAVPATGSDGRPNIEGLDAIALVQGHVRAEADRAPRGLLHQKPFDKARKLATLLAYQVLQAVSRERKLGVVNFVFPESAKQLWNANFDKNVEHDCVAEKVILEDCGRGNGRYGAVCAVAHLVHDARPIYLGGKGVGEDKRLTACCPPLIPLAVGAKLGAGVFEILTSFLGSKRARNRLWAPARGRSGIVGV